MTAQKQNLFAGTGRRCINPPPNIAHGGWGAQKHEQAEGIDLDLWVTALALSDQTTTAIVLDFDIQIITNQRADQIRAAVSRATDLPITAIRVSATHTHSGPVPYQSWIEKGFEMVAPWFENVSRWAAEAASEALSNLQPVEVRTGRGECFINSNRRALTPTGERFLGVNSDGVCDHEVLVIKLDSLDGKTVATLVNFACHGTIMGPLNRLITPDFPGAMKRVVEHSIGGKCLFLQGCAGDQGPVQGFIKETSVYKNLGAILGHEVARIALSLKNVPTKLNFREIIPSGAPLGMYDCEFSVTRGRPVCVMEKEISVPLREGLPEKKAAGEKLGFWQTKLKRARERKNDAAITEAIYMARRADIQLRMADDFGGKTNAGIRTHFITFGDVALVGCNVEPFCEIGLALKKQSPFPVTFMSGYTNGRMAYLPTAREWSKGGYEVENSPFGQNAAEVLQNETLQTLQILRDKI
ncbi:MAG: neutral/alkaline non-lysosomal ceramidase N-terminal domain-containing protein [Verrucomicrobiota bacterium]|nr:neutral/alkaline non-lysosomal ceramidase N-terminal domain-containing protein [Verrucomicrobiota bacterium]